MIRVQTFGNWGLIASRVKPGTGSTFRFVYQLLSVNSAQIIAWSEKRNTIYCAHLGYTKQSLYFVTTMIKHVPLIIYFYILTVQMHKPFLLSNLNLTTLTHPTLKKSLHHCNILKNNECSWHHQTWSKQYKMNSLIISSFSTLLDCLAGQFSV